MFYPTKSLTPMPKVETLSIPTNSGLDPIEYNRGQLIQFPDLQNVLNPCYQRDTEENKSYIENVINVDHFSVNLSGQLSTINKTVKDYELTEDIWLVRNTIHKSAHFENIWNVYLFGEIFGELKTDTRAPKIFDLDAMHFKMSNHRLYTEDWLTDFRHFVIGLGCKVKSISQLDIAIDGIGAKKYKDTFLQSRDPKCNVHLKGKTFITTSGSGKETTSLMVGKRGSDKYARLYNKTKEINDHSNKNYISQVWTNSGLKQAEDTYRFEVVLKSKLLKNYDVWKLDQPEYLASIFRTETDNWAGFYRITKDTNKARAMKANKFDLIDWDTLGAELLPKAKAKKPTEVYRAKQAIKTILRQKEVFGITTIEELISEYGLQEWLDSKSCYWAEDWAKEKARLEKLKHLLTTNLN
jgi:hypothetical protein